MRDLSLRQRLDPARNQIPNARWLVWFLALATPGFAILLVGATWQMVSDGLVTGWGLGLSVFGMWIFFVGLLIAPGAWCLYRAWRRIPALQLDAWGLVWGDDWSRDLSIEWREIDTITGRRVRSSGYSDRFVLIHPKNEVIPLRVARVFRWAAWVSRVLYGAPFLIGLRTLRIQPEDLVALIRRHFDGPIDLSAISLE